MYVAQDLSVACSIVIAIILLAAAVAKLADRQAAAQSFNAFGFHSNAALLTLVVPLLEAILGLMLLFGITTHLAGLATALLFILFGAIVARSVIHGDSHECNCFGALIRTRVSWALVYRNVFLAAVALYIAGVPGTSIRNRWDHAGWSWISAHTAQILVIVLAASVLHLAIAAELMRRSARVMQMLQSSNSRVKGLGVGALLPKIEVNDLDGESISLSEVASQSPRTLFIFISPGCSACAKLLPAVSRWQQTANELRIAIVGQGGVEINKRYAALYNLKNTYVSQDANQFTELGIVMTPSAALVTNSGQLFADLLRGPSAIERFAEGMQLSSHEMSEPVAF